MPRSTVIVFDFDGVICDSEPLHDSALAHAVRGAGWHYDPGEGDTHRFVGLGDRAAFQILAREAGVDLTPERLDELIDRKAERFSELAATNPPEPFEGVLALASALAREVPVGLCTASRLIEVGPILQRFGLMQILGTVVTREDVRETKPDPEPYALAVERLGGDPSMSLAIEDSPTGVASALAAGMRVIGIGSSRTREDLAQASAFVERIGMLDPARVLELARGVAIDPV
ncbi:MAG: HAD family phosphatase [Planctomycetota bacterium]